MTTDDELNGVGGRIRALRERQGRTLTDVAKDLGVSVSTLSRLESGQRRPTLDLLLPLARQFGVTLDDLVGVPVPDDPRVRSRPVRRDGATYVALSRRTDGVVAFKTTLPASRAGTPIRQVTHPGYDWVYVLSGTLRLALGDREHRLEAGEAAEFDTRIPHGFASADDRPVELINLMSPQGRRVHLREL